MCVIPALSRYSSAPKVYVSVCFCAVFIALPDESIVMRTTGVVHKSQGLSFRWVHRCWNR